MYIFITAHQATRNASTFVQALMHVQRDVLSIHSCSIIEMAFTGPGGSPIKRALGKQRNAAKHAPSAKPHNSGPGLTLPGKGLVRESACAVSPPCKYLVRESPCPFGPPFKNLVRASSW